MPTNEQLGGLFHAWRSEGDRTEATYLFNVALINDSITRANFDLAAVGASITTEAATGQAGAGAGATTPPPYLSLFSSLLHGTLSLEHYYNESISDPAFIDNEQAVLSLMLSSLKRLYENPAANPHARITEVILSAYNWLDNCVLTTSNPRNTRDALISLYRMLRCAEIKLNSLTVEERALGRPPYFIDFTSLNNVLPELLTKITRKISELEPRIAPVSAAAPEPEPTIEDHIKAQCNTLVDRANLPMSDSIRLVKELLTNLQAQIGELITEKRSNEAIRHQIPHALVFLTAVEQNERKISGKKYALELITANQSSYDELIAHSTVGVQTSWRERLEKLRAPSITATATYILSTLTFAPTVFYRALVPDPIRDSLESFVPDTLDSESKRELLALAETRLIDLNTALTESNARKLEKVCRLARDNPVLKRQLLVAPPARLEEIRVYAAAMQRLIVDCEMLSARVTATQQKLELIAGLNVEIDGFISQHHGFMVTLSLLFSRIWQGFKTDTAAKVEQVNSLRQQLAGYSRDYETFVNDSKRTIAATTIPTRISQGFLAALNSQTTTRPTATPTPRLSLGVAYQHIRTLFNQAKPEEPATGGEGPREVEPPAGATDGAALRAGAPPVVAQI